jgi:hypothetical protein
MDKKTNIFIQILAVLVVALMIGLAKWLNFPLNTSWSSGLTILITVFMCIIYMALHELTHGLFIRILSKSKPTFFIRLPFLCTGSNVYFNKISFIIIALAPVVKIGAALILLMNFLPTYFFLSLYIVEILNFASAAGDYFQVYTLIKLPNEALVQDNGKETKIFVPRKQNYFK